jgi:tRNA threonylcarbamoyladenosine biosynthesis protein TsaE
VAGAIAPALRPGDVVALSGDLGAGKTCFVQGAASALGVADRVTSPTFILVREHQGVYPIMHLDVYRLRNLQELTDLGYEEFLDPSSIVFIEWGDAIGPLLPSEFLEIQIRGDADDPRSIDLHAHGAGWNERLAQIGDSVLEWRARREGSA